MVSKKHPPRDLIIERVTPQGVSTLPDWAHIEILDVFVGHMDAPPEAEARGARAPYVLIGHVDDKRRRGLNPRAARYMAEALLKAADKAEALEVEMGYHPDQDKFEEIVKKIHES